MTSRASYLMSLAEYVVVTMVDVAVLWPSTDAEIILVPVQVAASVDETMLQFSAIVMVTGTP